MDSSVSVASFFTGNFSMGIWFSWIIFNASSEIESKSPMTMLGIKDTFKQ